MADGASELNRIKLSDIQIGEPLPWPVMDKAGILLLRKGYVISSQRQLEILIAKGGYLTNIDTRGNAQAAPPKPPSPFQIFDTFQLRLKSICENLKSPNPNDLLNERINQLSEDLQELCTQDSDALMGAIHLLHEGKYAFIHAIHCAILTEVFLKALNIATEERLQILGAALTHDVGMHDLQELLHKQTEPLTEQQRAKIQSHPISGYEMLKKVGVTNQVWLETVLHHHERIDGSGYTKCLKDADVSFPVRILSIVDIYCALIKPRAYRPALTSREALRELFLKRAGNVDNRLTQIFIKEIGLIPPGAFVRLQNGDIAIITHRGPDGGSPIAYSIVGPRGAPLDKPIKRNTALSDFNIKDMLPRDKTPNIQINLHQLWGYA